MAENIIENKTYAFAIEIVGVYQNLCRDRKEYTMGRQILRSGTALAAILREAHYAESKPDFIHKMAMALKEASETKFWLDLLHDTKFLDPDIFIPLKSHCEEIIKILTKIIITSKANLTNQRLTQS